MPKEEHMNASDPCSFPVTRFAERIGKLIYYLKNPHLRRLRQKRVGLNCYLKLNAPFLQRAGYQTILDIGANLGQFALPAWFAFPKARIISFEPLPDCFSQLRQNMADLDRFQAVNCGIGNCDGELPFARSEFSASSSFLPMARVHEHEFPATAKTVTVKVPVRQLDSLADEFRFLSPMLVKIDVQGYEREVLAGGGQVLRNAQTVIVESSVEVLYESQPLFAEIHRRMTELGFHYAGNFDQVCSGNDGRVLQVDAIFQR